MIFSRYLGQEKSRLLFLSIAGSSFEFFEFAVYSIFALNITRHLMPPDLQHDSLVVWYIVSYGLFFIGYIARPIGGTLFGLMSDKISRKSSFVVTMVLMSFATITIGLIPDYKMIGILAPCLLLIFRLLQGVSLGGELPASTVLLFEHAKSKQKIFIVMWFMALTNLGWLGGYVLDALLRLLLTSQQMDLYGWRLVFILGGTLALGTAMLRKKLMDAPIYQHFIKKGHADVKGLLKEICKYNKSSLSAGILIETLHGAVVFLVVVLLKNLLMQFYGFSSQQGTHVQIFVVVSWLIFGILSPFIVSKMNKLWVIPLAVFGCCSSVFLILIPEFHSMLFVFIILTAAFLSMIDGFAPYVVTRLFPIHLRATGFGISYNVGIALGGIIMVLFTARAISYQAPYILILSILLTVMIVYILFLISAFASKRFEALRI